MLHYKKFTPTQPPCAIGSLLSAQVFFLLRNFYDNPYHWEIEICKLSDKYILQSMIAIWCKPFFAHSAIDVNVEESWF